MSTCTTAPPAFRKRTWSARNDSSVCYANMSRSPAAMARRVFLSRSTKWRRDDEPLEPQARFPSRIPFEIECIDEGLAQTLVFEFRPSRVEEPTLRTRPPFIADNPPLYAPPPHCPQAA